MTPEEMRMDAYYYAFERTGNEAIDKVLSAIATAGKAYHNTADWNDECDYVPEYLAGKTPIEWIQNAAKDAAAEIDRLKGEVDDWKSTAEQHCRNESYYTELLDEIAKNFGQAAYTSDDGSIQQDPLRAKMPELVAMLRSRLDALVTAGEKVRDIWQNEGMYEGFDESVATLSAALAAAKEKVEP